MLFIFQSKAFVTSYPPYINFFEKTKEMIIECDNRYPRFHAFLKVMYFYTIYNIK